MTPRCILISILLVAVTVSASSALREYRDAELLMDIHGGNPRKAESAMLKFAFKSNGSVDSMGWMKAPLETVRNIVRTSESIDFEAADYHYTFAKKESGDTIIVLCGKRELSSSNLFDGRLAFLDSKYFIERIRFFYKNGECFYVDFPAQDGYPEYIEFKSIDKNDKGDWIKRTGKYFYYELLDKLCVPFGEERTIEYWPGLYEENIVELSHKDIVGKLFGLFPIDNDPRVAFEELKKAGLNPVEERYTGDRQVMSVDFNRYKNSGKKIRLTDSYFLCDGFKFCVEIEKGHVKALTSDFEFETITNCHAFWVELKKGLSDDGLSFVLKDKQKRKAFQSETYCADLPDGKAEIERSTGKLIKNVYYYQIRLIRTFTY